jgi:hypothetical protein
VSSSTGVVEMAKLAYCDFHDTAAGIPVVFDEVPVSEAGKSINLDSFVAESIDDKSANRAVVGLNPNPRRVTAAVATAFDQFNNRSREGVTGLGGCI